MALNTRKYERQHEEVLRDIRPAYVRLAEWLRRPSNAAAMFICGAAVLFFYTPAVMYADVVFIVYLLYFIWLVAQERKLAFRLPYGAKYKDPNNKAPGRDGKAEGILYLGNVKDTNEECWFTNSDTRTHILYLGTTGSGKTEGLKSLVTNAMTWGSGFVYVDGKADTDLWSSLSSLVRRFGRDDDMLVLNYMTGNSDARAPSNTMNPFSSGSASYLVNMLVSLMPEAEGDNAMWKDRAVALVASLMPALTWRRDKLEIPMSIGTIRDNLTLPAIIKLARDKVLPEEIRHGLVGYLDTLPGFIHEAYDDEGKVKPPGPNQPQYNTETANQQHGFLSMQFTRALQSLADEYGYIFDTQAADVDMVDVVLNRRMLVVLIPALEKSADETANLGKIVAAALKGMMGSALGSTVEGESATVIENKPTNSLTPFMTVFDEVGYYTAAGMAVMAAQARSLGFSLIYAAQDLPALEKRVKEEARSITANCNIKIFGKLEDPTQTKEFFEKTVGSTFVMEASGYQLSGGRGTGSYHDTMQAGLQLRARASYEGLRAFHEGQAVVAFGEMVVDTNIFYANPGHAKAMRVTRFMALPPPSESMTKNAALVSKVRDLMVHKTWTAMKTDVNAEAVAEIDAIAETMKKCGKSDLTAVESGMAGLIGMHVLDNDLAALDPQKAGGGAQPAQTAPASAPAAKPAEKTEAKQPPAQAAQPVKETEQAKGADTQNPESKTAANAENNKGGGKENPMSFFSKKPAAKTTEKQEPEKEEKVKQATQAQDQQDSDEGATSKPVDWNQMIKDQPKETAQAGETKERALPEKLTAQEQKTLGDAGKKARKALFGDSDEDQVDAAE